MRASSSLRFSLVPECLSMRPHASEVKKPNRAFPMSHRLCYCLSSATPKTRGQCTLIQESRPMPLQDLPQELVDHAQLGEVRQHRRLEGGGLAVLRCQQHAVVH